MRDLAPDIVRQRILIEGYHTVPIDQDVIYAFLGHMTARLRLRTSTARERTVGGMWRHSNLMAAADAGRETARNEQTGFVLRGQNGQIRERDSYGNDRRADRLIVLWGLRPGRWS